MKTLKLSNLKFLNLIFVLILFIFGRVFMGLNVFTLRLGEILIGISALFFIYFLVKDLVNFKNLSKEKKNITIIFALIASHAGYLLLFYGYEFFNLYPFKASSYIWVLGFFYVGRNSNYNFSSKKSLVVMRYIRADFPTAESPTKINLKEKSVLVLLSNNLSPSISVTCL